MGFNGYSVLCVVPARGGSKSIPRKNLCKIDGVSLVGRAAIVAASLDWIDHAVLSTDDFEIAEEGKRFGLEVPFMRPVQLSGDMATSVDMWRHAWLECEKIFKQRFDISILLEPTSPLRKPVDIELTVATMIKKKHMAAATVSRTPAHFTPHKTLTINDGCIGFYLKEGAKHSIRQTIPDYYHRNGICYAVMRQTLVDNMHILEDNCAAVVIDRPVVNIDEPFEIELAEYLLAKDIENGK